MTSAAVSFSSNSALVGAVHERVRIPVIACGGAGTPEHVRALVEKGTVDAVACASVFHYGTAPIPALKAHLSDHGIAVRT